MNLIGLYLAELETHDVKPLTKERILEIMETMKEKNISPEEVEQLYFYIMCNIIVNEDLDVEEVVNNVRSNLKNGIKSIRKYTPPPE